MGKRKTINQMIPARGRAYFFYSRWFAYQLIDGVIHELGNFATRDAALHASGLYLESYHASADLAETYDPDPVTA